MKKKIMISVVGACLFLFFTALGVYAFSLLEATGEDDSIDSWNKVDEYKINDNHISTITTSIFSSEYASGERMKIKQISNGSNQGFIFSDQYGDFYIDSNDIVGTKHSSVDTFCPSDHTVSYGLVGNVYSPDWGITLPLAGVYCPSNRAIRLTINSLETLALDLEGNGSETEVDAIDGSIAGSEIFNSNKVSVNGVISQKAMSGALTSEVTFDYSDSASNKKFTAVDYDTKANRAELRKIVARNIERIAKGSPITNSTIDLSNSNINTKDIHYYTFNGSITAPINGINQGEILTLGDGVAEDGSDKMIVSGERTVIVEGGNIYIDTDILNQDNNSILTIIVKRKKGDKKGGNIYIDTDVTNIDAILVADGSILSYNGNDILNSSQSTHINALRKQLLIFGSIATSNTIGNNDAPFGSDHYNISGTSVPNRNEYNLEYLRSFEVIRSEATTSSSCDTVEGEIVSRSVISYPGPNAGKYEFAGKRECNITQPGSGGLRTTEKLSPVVIEYNPLLQNSPPKILQK